LPAQVAAFQVQLAHCHRANGQPRLARQYLESALQVHEGLLGDQVGAVRRLRELAQLQVDDARLDVALELLDAALKRLQQQVGPRHPLAIELLGDIGKVRGLLGEPAAAERAYAQALVLALEVLGPRHPLTTQTRDQLATARMERLGPVTVPPAEAAP